MTDKSVEERLQAWLDAGIASMALLADLNAALAEIRRLREEFTEATEEIRALITHTAERDEDVRELRQKLASETARRESAEALLRDRLSELPDGSWVAAEEHFERYASTGSGQTKEIDR